MFVGLVSFSSSLAVLLQHLAVIGCVTEHECRTLLSEAVGPPVQTCLKVSIFRLVLCEHRTGCFAALLSVTVAC